MLRAVLVRWVVCTIARQDMPKVVLARWMSFDLSAVRRRCNSPVPYRIGLRRISQSVRAVHLLGDSGDGPGVGSICAESALGCHQGEETTPGAVSIVEHSMTPPAGPAFVV